MAISPLPIAILIFIFIFYFFEIIDLLNTIVQKLFFVLVGILDILYFIVYKIIAILITIILTTFFILVGILKFILYLVFKIINIPITIVRKIFSVLVGVPLTFFRYLFRSHHQLDSSFKNQYETLKESPHSIRPPPISTPQTPLPPPPPTPPSLTSPPLSPVSLSPPSLLPASLSPPPPPSPVEGWGGVLYLLFCLLFCFIIFKRTRPRSRATKKVRLLPVVVNPPQPQAWAMTDVPRNASSQVVSKLGVTIYLYKQLLRATNNFSTANRLGEGGFGTVYKGTFPDNKIVAVKLLNKANDIDFRKELDVNSRVKHKHIVSFYGYCIHGDSRLIVLEFVENNSLHHHLHGGNNIRVLDWANRVKIAVGTAKGLEYLHDGCHPTIIHRDVKPANILLNNNFEAKVADFGIARVCPESFDIYLRTGVIGTPCYVDPEYLHTQKLTVKSDVYSFGIVLLELVTGIRPQLMHHMINKLLPEALKKGNLDSLVDPRLQNNYDAREMHMIFACADACIRKIAKERPLMTKIVRVLKGETPHAR